MNVMLAAPEIFLLAATCFVLLLDVFIRDDYRYLSYISSLGALLITLVLVVTSYGTDKALAFNNMFVLDNMSIVLKASVIIVVIAAFIYSRPYLRERNIFKGEYYTLGLFSTLGMLVMISANTLLVIYLGLELLSLSLYAMVAFRRDDSMASEAGMKYFVLGAIASGMLLYGMSILYGMSGSLELKGVAAYVASQDIMNDLVLLFSLVFVVVGLGFKFGVVPFHMWVPDVYQGAPTPVTMFLGSAPKIAAFAMTIRLLVSGMEFGAPGWQQMLIPLAALSLIIGNLAAIAQSNLKRMFAYSTISHMGFVLLGVLSASETGYSTAMFYAITYALTALGGFAIIIMLSKSGIEADNLDDLRGLNDRHPWYAFMMLLFLFSMAGIPPLVGFYAKLVVLQAAVQAGLIWLAVLAVVMSVIGAFYYLRAVKLMYFDKPADTTSLQMDTGFNALLSINGIAVIALGIFPGLLMAVCAQAIQASL